MSAICNFIHNANDRRAFKPTADLFLSQERVESSPSMSFLQSAHAVGDNGCTFHFFTGVRWRRSISSWSIRLGSCLASQHLISSVLLPESCHFWIVHKQHVVSLKKIIGGLSWLSFVTTLCCVTSVGVSQDQSISSATLSKTMFTVSKLDKSPTFFSEMYACAQCSSGLLSQKLSSACVVTYTLLVAQVVIT